MMKRSALLLLLLLADASRGELQKRVINGRLCGPNEGTHHVVLTLKDSTNNYPKSQIYCGGSLISDRWVLTAAHCDDLKLVALLHEHPQRMIRDVGEIEERHKYVDSHGQHDIMLLKLKQSYSNLPTIKLPDPSNCRSPQIGAKVQFTGRFRTSNTTAGDEKGKSIPTVDLLCGDLTVTKCPDLFLFKWDPNDSGIKSFPYDLLLCAEDAKVDVCRGDSGGSMMVKEKGVDVLYGVARAGIDIICHRPAFFLDVCRYRAWIHTITGI